MPTKRKSIHRDGTQKIFSSPSYDGTFLYFTGRGDSETEGIGNGEAFRLTNEEGVQYKEIITGYNEDVFLKDGYVFWQNATVGDAVSLEIVLPANTVYPSLEQQGNAGIIDENGTISYITASQTPDETWIGTHLLFPIDVTLFRFVNNFSLLGTNEHGLLLESSDVAKVNKELKFRLSFKSEAPNPNLVVSVLMEMYREHTV
jgi:hypothetical protein